MMNDNKTKKAFCFVIINSYLSPLVNVLPLENKKKNEFSFCIFLAYSYLCRQNRLKHVFYEQIEAHKHSSRTNDGYTSFGFMQYR